MNRMNRKIHYTYMVMIKNNTLRKDTDIIHPKKTWTFEKF